jgi:hypothetical protein
LTDSDSLRRLKWLKALNGTGVATTALLPLLPLPPPPPLPPDAELPVERVVPPNDVFALEETLLLLLVLVSTVELALAVEVCDNADPELTPDIPNAEPALAGASAEVDDVAKFADEEIAFVEGVSSALPGEGELPEPAPDDEPAVLLAPPEDPADEELKAD